MEKYSKLTEPLSIKSYEVDWSGKLKLQSLFQYFQEIAGTNATQLGVGFEELRKRRLFWVLSRMRVEIIRLPIWRETVELSTWPKGVDKLFALRDFCMKDTSGDTLLNAASAWLLVDMEKGRPQRFDALPVDISLYRGEDAVRVSLDKLQPSSVMSFRYERRVMPGDLDVNRHVNNAVYIGWIMDCFSPADLGDRSVRSLEVNYLGEVVLGDIIVLNCGEREGREYEIEAVRKEGDSKAVQAVLAIA